MGIVKNLNKDNNEQARPIVGIDLGTTNSAIAVMEGRVPVLLVDKDNQAILPSVVHLSLDERVIVGVEAEAAKVAMPERTISAVKRNMGQTKNLSLGPNRLLPEEVTALILKELKLRAEKHFGLESTDPIEAVITVPAYFTDQQRRATKQAGELGGFIVERIINEPTAAALAFGLSQKKYNGNIIVYDLGGGTFDVSVVEMFDGILEVKASKGNNNLGGEDFDWLIVDYLADLIKEQWDINPLDDLRSKTLLKDHAETAKKTLSFVDSVEINIPLLGFAGERPISLNQVLLRTEFETMIAKHLAETMQCVRDVLADAKLTAPDIDSIILVGGSTRIPKVAQLMADFFAKSPLQDVDPDEAVALGAAVQSGIKTGTISPNVLIATDVAPFSMGIAAATLVDGEPTPGAFSVIIPRNMTIPVKRTESYWTFVPGQTKVSIEIYQGEMQWARENHFLGKFLFDGIPENYEQLEQVNVTFGYNLNGILEVTAKSESSGKEMSIQVSDEIERSSRQAFAKSVKRLEQLQQDASSDFKQQSLPFNWDDIIDDDDDGDDDGGFDFESVETDLTRAGFDYERLESSLAEAIAATESLMEGLSLVKQKQMQRLIDRLNKATQEKDREKQEEYLKELIDFMFKEEMEASF